MSRAQRRIDTKLLCNQCGLAQTLFNRRHQDTHHCPVCESPGEDQDHLFTCPNEEATNVFKKGLNELAEIMDELDTSPELQRAITGNMLGMRSGNQPHSHSFGNAYFGHNLSLHSILCDQAELGWMNFFMGR